MNKLFQTLLIIVSACGFSPLANGALLVFEGFNYSSSVSNGATMNGVASNAIGLTGNYGVLNSASSGGSAITTYNTSGLSFGSNFYPVTGGAIQATVTSPNATSSFSITGIQLNAGTATETIWTSYLANFQTISASFNGNATLRMNSTISGDSSASYFITAPETTSAVAKPGVAYDNNLTAYSGMSTIAANTTFLVIGSFTNVGETLSVGNSGVATYYMFTLSQYDNWIASGGSEATLGSFSGFTVSDTVTSGLYAFNNSRFLQLSTVSGGTGTQSVTIDELRYGTTLQDVVAVPEPTIIGLTGLALVVPLFFRKRKRF